MSANMLIRKNIIYIVLGVLMVFLLSLDSQIVSQEICYIALYNTAKFFSLYFVIFSFGLISVLNKMFMPEMLIRFHDKFEIIVWYGKKIVFHAIKFSAVCLVVNFILFPLKCVDWNPQETGSYIPLFIDFVGQAIGWTFIGFSLLLIYLLTNHIVIAFLCNISVFMFLTFIQRVEVGISWEVYFKVYTMMFQALREVGGFQTALHWCYYICLTGVLCLVSYIIVKKKDFIIAKRR